MIKLWGELQLIKESPINYPKGFSWFLTMARSCKFFAFRNLIGTLVSLDTGPMPRFGSLLEGKEGLSLGEFHEQKLGILLSRVLY